MKNNAIEFYRFIFTLMIVLHHVSANGKWEGAYIGVEFFFILSGFLMTLSIEKHSRKNSLNHSGGVSAFKYTFHRIIRFYPMVIFAFLLFFLTKVFQNHLSLFESFELLAQHIWELLFLGLSGVGQGMLNNNAWYLSALVIVSFFVYYFIQNHYKLFFEFIAPCSVIAVYGMLSQQFSHMGYNVYNATSLWIKPGIWRALAGICLGCLCYRMYMHLKGICLTHIGVAILNFVEVALIVLVAIIVYKSGHTQKDFIITGMLAALVVIVFWNQTPIDRFFNNSISAYLGKISYAIYLTHIWIMGIFVSFDIFLDKPWARELVFIVVAVAFGAFADWFVDQCLILTKKLYKPEKFFKPVDEISLE